MSSGDETRAQRPDRLDAFVKAPATSAEGAYGTVLTILNDPELAKLLGHCLSAAGFRIIFAHGAAEGVAQAQRRFPDVVLLDSRPLEVSSTEIWRAIRASVSPELHPATILFIHDENDIDPDLGLEFGPCDFVVYPFVIRELVLRVDAIVRARRGGVVAAAPRRRRYLVGPLELDVDRHTAMVLGVPMHVSSLETRLLAYLIEHRGQMRSREDLLTDVWGYTAGVATRTADAHVNRLRSKLGPAAALIETVRGSGYRLSAQYPVVVRD